MAKTELKRIESQLKNILKRKDGNKHLIKIIEADSKIRNKIKRDLVKEGEYLKKNFTPEFRKQFMENLHKKKLANTELIRTNEKTRLKLINENKRLDERYNKIVDKYSI